MNIYRHLQLDTSLAVIESEIKADNYSGNSMFNMLNQCYNAHIPLVLSPDDFLNSISCIWAKYINIKHVEFKNQFLKNEDISTLEVILNGEFTPERMPEVIYCLGELLKDNCQCEPMDWAVTQFTTSMLQDVLIRRMAILNTPKEYYSYNAEFNCGFPSVTLLGTGEDWLDLVEVLGSMPTLGDKGLENWKEECILVVLNMLQDVEVFWHKCITLDTQHNKEDTMIDGWIGVFSPFCNQGTWWKNNAVPKDNILNLDMDFPLMVNDDSEHSSVVKLCLEHSVWYDRQSELATPNIDLRLKQ